MKNGQRQWLREHHDAFVTGHGDKGTFKKAWKDKLREELEKDQSEVLKAAFIEAVLVAADEVWEDDRTNPFDKRQLSFAFMIGGQGITQFVTFSDPFVVGKHRKVAGIFATPWHLQKSLDLKKIKLDQASDAYKRDQAVLAAALAVAKGDFYARLWDFRDGQEPKVA